MSDISFEGSDDFESSWDGDQALSDSGDAAGERNAQIASVGDEGLDAFETSYDDDSFAASVGTDASGVGSGDDSIMDCFDNSKKDTDSAKEEAARQQALMNKMQEGEKKRREELDTQKTKIVEQKLIRAKEAAAKDAQIEQEAKESAEAAAKKNAEAKPAGGLLGDLPSLGGGGGGGLLGNLPSLGAPKLAPLGALKAPPAVGAMADEVMELESSVEELEESVEYDDEFDASVSFGEDDAVFELSFDGKGEKEEGEKDAASASDAIRKAEDEENANIKAEEAGAAKAEGAAKLKVEEEEAAAKLKVEEEEEAAKLKVEEEEAAANVKAEEEEAAKVKAEEEEAAKVKAEEEEAAKVKAEEEEAAKVKAEEEEEAAEKMEVEQEVAAKIRAAAKIKAAAAKARAEELLKEEEEETAAKLKAEEEEAAGQAAAAKLEEARAAADKAQAEATVEKAEKAELEKETLAAEKAAAFFSGEEVYEEGDTSNSSPENESSSNSSGDESKGAALMESQPARCAKQARNPYDVPMASRGLIHRAVPRRAVEFRRFGLRHGPTAQLVLEYSDKLRPSKQLRLRTLTVSGLRADHNGKAVAKLIIAALPPACTANGTVVAVGLTQVARLVGRLQKRLPAELPAAGPEEVVPSLAAPAETGSAGTYSDESFEGDTSVASEKTAPASSPQLFRDGTFEGDHENRTPATAARRGRTVFIGDGPGSTPKEVLEVTLTPQEERQARTMEPNFHPLENEDWEDPDGLMCAWRYNPEDGWCYSDETAWLFNLVTGTFYHEDDDWYCQKDEITGRFVKGAVEVNPKDGTMHFVREGESKPPAAEIDSPGRGASLNHSF
jgi:hypothetical protein